MTGAADGCEREQHRVPPAPCTHGQDVCPPCQRRWSDEETATQPWGPGAHAHDSADDGPAVCPEHLRFAPCRRCEPGHEKLSTDPADVERARRFQTGEPDGGPAPETVSASPGDLLRHVAAAREAYARGAPKAVRQALLMEAQAYRNAANVVDAPDVRPWGLLPTWWDWPPGPGGPSSGG